MHSFIIFLDFVLNKLIYFICYQKLTKNLKLNVTNTMINKTRLQYERTSEQVERKREGKNLEKSRQVDHTFTYLERKK